MKKIVLMFCLFTAFAVFGNAQGVSVVLNIWDKSGNFERYNARFRVINVATKKVYTVNKVAGQDRAAEVGFPNDFNGADFQNGIYTYSVFVDGQIVLNGGKFQIKRVGNTYLIDVTYANYVPLKGKLRGSGRTWLQSADVQTSGKVTKRELPHKFRRTQYKITL